MSCFWTRLDPDLSNSRALQRGLQQRHSRWEAVALKLVSSDLQGVTGEASWLFHRESSEKEFKSTFKIHLCQVFTANSWDQLFLLFGIWFQFLLLWLTKTLCEHNSSDSLSMSFLLLLPVFSHGVGHHSDIIWRRMNYCPSTAVRRTLTELLQMETHVIMSTHGTCFFHEQKSLYEYSWM